MNMPYKYFAFISYSRKDSRAAAFLHRSLEHFRIPTRFVDPQYRPANGKFLRPVFRDKRDLANTEGSFTEGIRAALEATRYLFVVCSRSAAGSVWVDEEIKYFLAHNGNDLLKVVPIVLEGNPGAGDETECLPATLRRKEITLRNLPTMIPDEGAKETEGWENGIVQALSYVLHVRRENIKASIDAERMRQMKIYLGIGVVCAFIFAALAFWAAKAERRAEANRKIAVANEIEAKAQRDKAEDNWRIAEANREKAESNEKRAVAGEKDAKEKKELAEKTLTFVKKILQEGKPDEHGPKNVVDLLSEQVSKIELLEPESLKYSVSLVVGQIMLEQSMFRPAERLLKGALEFSQKANDSKSVFAAANLLGIMYANTGRIEESKQMYELISGDVSESGEPGFDQALLLFNMACTYRRTAERVKAAELCEKAFAAAGQNYSLKARVKELMAALALERGEIAIADKYCGEAEGLEEQSKKSPRLSLREMRGRIQISLGRYDEARRNLQLAYEGAKKKSGEVSLDASRSVNSMGVLEWNLGNYERALRCFEEAVAIMEKLFPAGSSELATMYNNVGNVLEKLKSHTRARIFYNKSLEMEEKFGGKNSPKLDSVLTSLAHMSEDIDGDYEKAKGYYNRIIEIAAKAFGGDCVQIADARFGLAGINLKEGDPTSCLSELDDAMRIYGKLNRSDDGTFAEMLSDYASALQMTGAHSNAVASIERACEIAQRRLDVKKRTRIMKNREVIVANEQIRIVKKNDISSDEIESVKAAAKKALDEGDDPNAEDLYVKLAKLLVANGQAFSSEYAMVCNNRGVIAYRSGRYPEALAFQIKARDLNIAISGSNDVNVAVNHRNIADALKAMEEYLGAEHAYNAALSIYMAHNERYEKSISYIYTELSKALGLAGKSDKAIAFAKKAISMDEKIYGTHSVVLASDHEDLAELLRKAKQYDESMKHYFLAIEIRESGEKPNNKKLAFLHNQVGISCGNAGKIDLAVEHFRKSYELNLDIYGITNRETAVSLHNLGDFERRNCDYTNAISHLAQSLEVKRRVGGFSQAEISIHLNDLGIAYDNAGLPLKALEAYKQALIIDLKEYGREHSEVMTVYGNMAIAYRNLKKDQEELDCLRRALDVSLLLFDEGSEEVLNRYRNMADCLFRQRKYENCAKIRKRLLHVMGAGTDANDMALADAYYLYGDALYMAEDYEGAKTNYVHSINIYRIGGTNFLESIAVAEKDLGWTNMRLGMYDEAIVAFREAGKIVARNAFPVAEGSALARVDEKIAECEKLKNTYPVVMITRVAAGGVAEGLGIRKGDVWLAIGDWRADGHAKMNRIVFWKSAISSWEGLAQTNRVLSLMRKDGESWRRVDVKFTTPHGDFNYRLDSMPKDDFANCINCAKQKSEKTTRDGY